jgi:hypothetical protein
MNRLEGTPGEWEYVSEKVFAYRNPAGEKGLTIVRSGNERSPRALIKNMRRRIRQKHSSGYEWKKASGRRPQWGVAAGDEVVTLARKNRQLKQLTKALASRITVLEKRLSGLGWSVG